MLSLADVVAHYDRAPAAPSPALDGHLLRIIAGLERQGDAELELDARLLARIVDPERAVSAVVDVDGWLYRLVQFAIREAVARGFRVTGELPPTLYQMLSGSRLKQTFSPLKTSPLPATSRAVAVQM